MAVDNGTPVVVNPDETQPVVQPTPTTPAATPATPAPAAVVDPAATPAAPAVPGAPVDEPRAPVAPDWKVKRIGELTARDNERKQRIAELEAELAAARMQREQQQPPVQPGEPPRAPVVQPQLTEAQIEARAAAIAQQQAFDRECNLSYAAGKEKYPDLDEKLSTFKLLGGLTPDALNAALATGAAHDVLYKLGGNPDEAARIMALPPLQMAVEMAKIATTASAVAKAPPISAVPAPIDPITSAARTPDGLVDEIDDDEWFRRRREQLKQRRSA